ncbi:MAG: hypothetical protein LBP22_13505 [Deltaproteobacteria bacterium]|nr:hypothetical protein [Deltaproteobacteria bacterium]
MRVLSLFRRRDFPRFLSCRTREFVIGFRSLQKRLFYDTLLDPAPENSKVKNADAGPNLAAIKQDQGGLGMARCLRQNLPSQSPEHLELTGSLQPKRRTG